MIISEKDVISMGLTDDCMNASVVFRYQKSGGILVCPSCGEFLGLPKQNKQGTHTNGPRPKCGKCGMLAVVKCAQIATRPGTITRAIMRKSNGVVIVAKVKLNKLDKFDKNIGGMQAFRKLMAKCKPAGKAAA